VSPFAFFQVNKLVFEKMLELINNFAGIDASTTLFDICCGTGAIGICLSKIPKKVIGVELLVSAVDNAKENVSLNKDLLTEEKMEFHAGKAEETLPPIVRRVVDEGGKIIGIVDPPRGGLHGDVLKALRTCKGLDRLIYVSCNAVSQMRDLKWLCYESKSKRKGPCFKPVNAVGADLFPHTNHIESIVLLERSYE
jgi:tRNA (uracil-5-)-methyltransferase